MSNFTFTETKIKDLYLIDTKVFGDNRGYFMETYVQKDFFEAGLCYRFVQSNQSCSGRGVLRGLHFQKKHPQAKLVRVLHGEVFDVAVDLRKSSETCGQWFGAILSGENRRQMMIPRGFAHGFLVLSESAEFVYQCDDFYYPEDEGGIIWNDPTVAVEWPGADAYVFSEKDRKLPTFAESRPIFDYL